jgi:dihydroflavonol-4-reductase
MKALVLGATGLIGSNLVRTLLNRGHEVRALVRPSNPAPTLSGLDIERVSGTLEDGDTLSSACRGVQVIYHAAGYYPSGTVPTDRARNIASRQIRLLLDIVRDARPSIEKFVFVSTLTTIGPATRPDGLADEACAFQTAYTGNPYLMAKADMEREVLASVRQGVPAVVLNPTACFGPYDSKPTSGTQIVMLAKRLMPAYVEGRTNAIDVRDVAAGMVHAAERGRVGERYILGNWNTTQKALNRLIAQVAGVAPPSMAIPFAAARLGATLGDRLFRLIGRPAPVPGFFIEVLRHMQHYDCSKAIGELDYPQSPVDQAVRDALGWFRTHGYA